MSSLSAVRQYIQESSAPFANALGLTKVPAFADVILVSAVAFTTAQAIFSPVLSSAFFPKSYGRASSKTKHNWNTHIVSEAHALIVIPLAIRCLTIASLDEDRAFGWADEAGFVQAISLGYFLWDLYESVIFFSDVGFVIHAISCLAIYGMAFQPFLAYYGPRFLLWEFSTLFLNMHWLLDKTGQTGGSLQLVNGCLLLASFFAVRLVYGGKMSYDFFHTLYEVRDQIPFAYVLIYGFGNILLQGLNWFWFTKMVASLRKRFDSRNTAPPKADQHRKINGKAD